LTRTNLIAFSLSLLFIYLFLFSPHPTRLGESGLLAAFFESRVDWSEVGALIRGLKLVPFLGALFFLLLSLVLRGWRWASIASSLSPVRFSLMFHLSNLGYMCNNLLPMRLGEVIRAGALSAKSSIRFSGSIATVVLERLLDMLSALVCLFLLLLFMPANVREAPMVAHFQALFPLLALGAGVVFSLMISLVLWRTPVLKGFQRILFFFPAGLSIRLQRILNSFAMGLSSLQSPTRALLLFFQSTLIFSCYILSLAFMLRAFGIQDVVITQGEFASLLLILVFVTLGYMIPAAPGAMGTVHSFTALALTLLGASESQAMGFAIGNHLLTWLVLTIMGFLALPALGFSFSDLMQLKEEKA
jgi:glycosyltransferase 2 family protein